MVTISALAICFVKTIPKIEVTYFIIPYSEIFHEYLEDNKCKTFMSYDNFSLSDLFKIKYINCPTAKFLRETCLFGKNNINFNKMLTKYSDNILENITIYQTRNG